MGFEDEFINSLSEETKPEIQETESTNDNGTQAESGEAHAEHESEVEETNDTETITNSEQESDEVAETGTDSSSSNQIKEWSGGRFDDISEVPEDLFEIYEQNNELYDAYEQLKIENDQLKQQESEPKFASPLIEKINDYIANGGKDLTQFISLQNSNVDEMDAKDVLALQLQINEGYSSDDAKFIVEQEFRLDEDMLPDHKRLIELKLSREADKARTSLNESKISDTTPYSVKQAEEFGRVETERIQNWEKISNDVLDEVSIMEFDLSDNDTLTVELSNDELSQYQSELNEIISSQKGLNPDQHGLDFAKEFVKNRYIQNNFNELIAEARKYERSLIEEKHFVENHHPSSKDNTLEQRDSSTSKPLDFLDQVMGLENR